MNKLLLTGATGFIGRHCLPFLVESGYEIHAVSSRSGEQMAFPSVLWHQANLLDIAQIEPLISQIQPSHLLHLAWYLSPGQHNSGDNLLWVQAGIELLRCFQRYGGQRVVMAGSGFEYDWNYGYCSEDVTPTVPSTFYGKCKHALQLLFAAFSQEMGLSAAWTRIFFIYGPHENPRRLVSSVISSLLKREPALCSHGNQIRDFLHVHDVASALVAVLNSSISGPINIASGEAVALKAIVHKIADQLDGKDLVQLGAVPAAANDTPFVVANVNRLLEEVKWQPSYDLDSGLAQTIEWWKMNLNHNEQKS